MDNGLTIVQPEAEYLLVINNKDNEEIVRIHPNGDVEISGDVNEAARILWNSVAQVADTSLIIGLKGKV